MTTYSAIKLDDHIKYLQLPESGIAGDTEIDHGFLENILDPIITASHTPQPKFELHNSYGARASDPGEAVYNQVWVFPANAPYTPVIKTIDAGFISSGVYTDIHIVSTHTRPRIDSIATIEKIREEGTILVYPPLPQNVYAGSEYFHPLTIFEEGPPFQDTEYIYTITGTLYTIKILGQRISAFPYEPDWNSMKLQYRFMTVLNRSNKFKEQRRALYSRVKRVLTASYSFWEGDLQKVHNDIKRLNDSIIAVPVYTEPITTGSIITGETVITANKDISGLYNLRHLSEFVMIIDDDDRDNVEARKIESVDEVANEITLENAVLASFNPARTVIYPVVLCFLEKSFKPRYITDDTIQFTLTFEEIKTT